MTTVSRTASFTIDQPVGVVFPLFSPEGERHWVPGWDYVNVMGTTDLSEDYVFLTPDPDHGKDAVWIVKRYMPEAHLVQLYWVEPEEKVGLVTVRCNTPDEGRTEVEVTYQYTALSKAGERFIRRFDQPFYDGYIGEWKTLLDRFFDSGETD